AGRSRMIDSALPDLPQRDSPTSATVSPSATSHDTPSTARTTPPRVRKCVWRSTTSRRVPTARGSVARVEERPGFAGAPPSAGGSGGPFRGPSVTSSHRELRRADGEARVLAADRLRDTGPAMLHGPAPPFAAEPPVQRAVGQHARDRLGQRARIAFRDE